jgi:hypothetical protein
MQHRRPPFTNNAQHVKKCREVIFAFVQRYHLNPSLPQDVTGSVFATIGWDKTMTLITCQSQARQQAFKARQAGSYNNNHYNHRPPNP